MTDVSRAHVMVYGGTLTERERRELDETYKTGDHRALRRAVWRMNFRNPPTRRVVLHLQREEGR